MEEAYEAKFINDALEYTIRNISDNKRFWMVRTKKGFFLMSLLIITMLPLDGIQLLKKMILEKAKRKF